MSHYIPTNLDPCLVSIPHHVIETIKVGRTNLKIPDIYRSLSFYRDLLGFQLMTFRLKFPYYSELQPYKSLVGKEINDRYQKKTITL